MGCQHKKTLLKVISGSCNCLVAQFSSARVPTGCFVKVPVYLTMKKPEMNLQEQLLIRSNDPVASKILLTIKGRISPGSSQSKEPEITQTKK
jgi:hypothetical protein